MSNNRIIVEDRKYAVIDGDEYPVIKMFQLAHVGWECDSEGYIIDYHGVPRLLLSDHGAFSIMPCDMIDPVGDGPVRNDVTALELQIDMYKDLIGQAEEAIAILTGDSYEKA